MRADDPRVAKQKHKGGGAGDLPGMWTDLVQLRLERAVGPHESLRRHGRSYVRGSEAALRISARESEHAQHPIGTVDQGQALLRLELQSLQLCGFESLQGGIPLAVGIGDFAF